MKIIFLDRDGVINKYPGDKKYVTSWRNFRFLPRVKKAIAILKDNNFKLFIISNQAGVGKGIFSQQALDIITGNMLRKIEESHGKIDGVYYCTHPPEANCSCRKPRPGLLHLAIKNLCLASNSGGRPSLKGAFFIGDTIRDISAAKAAGCKSILVLSGKEKLLNRKNWEAQPDFIFKDLYAACAYLAGG
ncbi:MAG: HAD family hydrolase [Candidatus Omnitrophota bacterium]|nr:HAD family hydrolase [Candidatus Omnitrophota bacterium]